VELVCAVFEVPQSCYYEYKNRKSVIDASRVKLRAKVNEVFHRSRSAAGSRTIVGLLNQRRITIGRYKARCLMREAGLTYKQPSHKYKKATVERPDIPNALNREFNVGRPNKVWRGDIAYAWAGSRWCYLATVIDLYARRIVGWAISAQPDAALTVKALEMAWEQRIQPADVMFR